MVIESFPDRERTHRAARASARGVQTTFGVNPALLERVGEQPVAESMAGTNETQLPPAASPRRNERR
jgi:hypothetical protein